MLLTATACPSPDPADGGTHPPTDPDGDGFTANDCAPDDPSVYPGAQEFCDELDNNCDGRVDENVTIVLNADRDADGYGDPFAPLTTCGHSDGYVDNAEDCDDSDPDVTVEQTWYPDLDGDGFGDPNAGQVACDPPAGFVTDSSECDDSNPEGTACPWYTVIDLTNANATYTGDSDRLGSSVDGPGDVNGDG